MDPVDRLNVSFKLWCMISYAWYRTVLLYACVCICTVYSYSSAHSPLERRAFVAGLAKTMRQKDAQQHVFSV